MREQRAALEDVADAAAQHHGIERADVLALDLDRATIGFDQPVGQLEQGGLARAGAADNGEERALADRKAEVVDGLRRPAVEAFADMGECDQGCSRHRVLSQLPSSPSREGEDSTSTLQAFVELILGYR